MDIHRDKEVEATDSEASETIVATLYVDDEQARKKEEQISQLLA